MVSPSYTCNTQTITRIRPTTVKPNNLEAWIKTIGTSSNLDDVMKAIDEVETVLNSEEKVKLYCYILTGNICYLIDM